MAEDKGVTNFTGREVLEATVKSVYSSLGEGRKVYLGVKLPSEVINWLDNFGVGGMNYRATDLIGSISPFGKEVSYTRYGAVLFARPQDKDGEIRGELVGLRIPGIAVFNNGAQAEHLGRADVEKLVLQSAQKQNFDLDFYVYLAKGGLILPHFHSKLPFYVKNRLSPHDGEKIAKQNGIITSYEPKLVGLFADQAKYFLGI